MIEEKDSDDEEAESEPMPDHGFIPPNLSDEAKQMLINMWENLKKWKENKEELSKKVEDALDELNDDSEDIEIDEEIQKDEFDDLLNEFILDNKDKYGEDLNRMFKPEVQKGLIEI